MKQATLFDSTINLRHDLAALVEKNGHSLSIGRGENSVIQAGKNSGSPHLSKVSRNHALIIYEPSTDTFVYTDYSSTNHSRIKRKGGWVMVDESQPKIVLETGDQIYLSKSFSAGYGPLIFCQGKEGKDLNDNDGTQRVE